MHRRCCYSIIKISGIVLLRSGVWGQSKRMSHAFEALFLNVSVMNPDIVSSEYAYTIREEEMH